MSKSSSCLNVFSQTLQWLFQKLRRKPKVYEMSISSAQSISSEALPIYLKK